MSTENKILDLTYPAAEDLSDDQYKFVVLNSSGQVRRPDSASEVALGILQNAPESGEAAVVRVIGVSKVQANNAIGIGTFVGPNTSRRRTREGPGQCREPRLRPGRHGGGDRGRGRPGKRPAPGMCPAISDAVHSYTTVTTKSTAGAVTYTAAELVGGLISASGRRQPGRCDAHGG